MKKDHETVLACDPAHQIHHNLILVVGEIGLAEDRSELELVWSDLVVPCLERNPETVSGNLKVAHELGHTGRNGTEIVVVQLLVLG